MKWGVRRTKEQLRYNKASIKASLDRRLSKVVTKNGVRVKSVSQHFAEQSDDRKDRRVNSQEIIDALENPLNYGSDLDKIRINAKGQRSLRYIGSSATVNVNPDTGVIATAWRTGSVARRRYSRKGER
jgi:radical SAM superfamily enzyme with C-terminal helix-hairpin-helix motif